MEHVGLTVRGRTFEVRYMTRDCGTVVGADGTLLGWSQDEERRLVHVLGFEGYREWRGTDLLETVRRALEEVTHAT